ncbi:hypothetical protein N7495_000915 [Penicillium taxi]|uniref:uncharacterized protein n=1 Tax=Penicillium taxi TaxID=168475 RepID=UPI0025452501|nr:uncharacterized protein N7495_000915 [Penicillium taxi]KAJ5908233.1 hypothetical protein N7495_000915 [Penicillium taxi]
MPWDCIFNQTERHSELDADNSLIPYPTDHHESTVFALPETLIPNNPTFIPTLTSPVYGFHDYSMDQPRMLDDTISSSDLIQMSSSNISALPVSSSNEARAQNVTPTNVISSQEQMVTYDQATRVNGQTADIQVPFPMTDLYGGI